MKVSELSGALLDCWVAFSLGFTVDSDGDLMDAPARCGAPIPFHPSTDWRDGGPLMEKFKLSPYVLKDDRWAVAGTDWFVSGDTPLQAISRAVVRVVYGDELPEIEMLNRALNSIAPPEKQA